MRSRLNNLAAQSDFNKLSEIGDHFQQRIRQTGTQQVQEIADSFRTYLLDLEKTFECVRAKGLFVLTFLRGIIADTVSRENMSN